MSKNNLLSRALTNLIRNKVNIINIILLSFSSAIIIFGFSYASSINKLWSDWTKKSIDFRTFSISYDYDNIREEDAIEKLKKINHIEGVTRSSGYLMDGLLDEYINDDMDGQIIIKGIPNNAIDVILGEKLGNSKDNYEIICAKNFNPNSQVYKVNFNEVKLYDLSNDIGKTLKIKIAGSTIPDNFKLVGLYDSNYNYSAGDVCYASSETVSMLNMKYQKQVFNSGKSDEYGTITYLPIYMTIDSVDNLDEIMNEIQKQGFYADPVININTSIGNNVVKIVLVLTWVSCILSLAIILITSFRQIQEREKEFAISKAIGYAKKDINSLLYIESILLGLISFCLSILITIIALFILKNNFLASNVEFSRMTISMNYIAVILGLVIVVIIPSIASFVSSKKIDNINILNILKG